ncbi:MAG: hypothetical protein HC860_06430 [Alkalinema sp. RU_4_3]|nr:hypothetical protein [Alkalinema sp. RU_4_3]
MVADWVHLMLQQQVDIDWLGSIREWDGVVAMMHQTDVLLFGTDDVYQLPEFCFQLLGDYPRLKIVLLTTAGNEAIVYWRDLHCQQMQVLSSQGLIESIRQIYLGGF